MPGRVAASGAQRRAYQQARAACRRWSPRSTNSRAGKSPTLLRNNPHPRLTDLPIPFRIAGNPGIPFVAHVLPKLDDEPLRHQRGTHMKTRFTVRALLVSTVIFAMYVVFGVIAGAQAPLTVGSARITINARRTSTRIRRRPPSSTSRARSSPPQRPDPSFGPVR